MVGLAPELSGYVVPSRLYGVLAVGRPVIAAADADGETAQLVNYVGCGVVVPPGRPELLVPFYLYLLTWFFLYCYPIARATQALEARTAVR